MKVGPNRYGRKGDPRRFTPLNQEQQKLVLDHMKVAYSCASVYTRRTGRDLEVSVSGAFEGLVRAAQTHEQRPGAQFVTYAFEHIQEAIRRAHKREDRNFLFGSRVHGGRSADSCVLGSSSVQGERDTESAALAKMDVDTLLTRLPNRLRRVIQMLFFDDLTLRQAGEVIGVSGERVRQMKEEALRLMRGAA